jgi:hypothetical protein
MLRPLAWEKQAKLESFFESKVKAMNPATQVARAIADGNVTNGLNCR